MRTTLLLGTLAALALGCANNETPSSLPPPDMQQDYETYDEDEDMEDRVEEYGEQLEERGEEMEEAGEEMD